MQPAVLAIHLERNHNDLGWLLECVDKLYQQWVSFSWLVEVQVTTVGWIAEIAIAQYLVHIQCGCGVIILSWNQCFPYLEVVT